jgi:hypothetical protein
MSEREGEKKREEERKIERKEGNKKTKVLKLCKSSMHRDSRKRTAISMDRQISGPGDVSSGSVAPQLRVVLVATF